MGLAKKFLTRIISACPVCSLRTLKHISHRINHINSWTKRVMRIRQAERLSYARQISLAPQEHELKEAPGNHASFNATNQGSWRMHSPFQFMFGPCYFFPSGYMLFGLNLLMKRACVHVKTTDFVATGCQREIFPWASVSFNCWSEFAELAQNVAEERNASLPWRLWLFVFFNLKGNNPDKYCVFALISFFCSVLSQSLPWLRYVFPALHRHFISSKNAYMIVLSRNGLQQHLRGIIPYALNKICAFKLLPTYCIHRTT